MCTNMTEIQNIVFDLSDTPCASNTKLINNYDAYTMNKRQLILNEQTKNLFLSITYVTRSRQSRREPYIGAIKQVFGGDSDDVTWFIKCTGRVFTRLHRTPIGQALENNAVRWPRVPWGDDCESSRKNYRKAMKWIAQSELRIRDIHDLDKALLAEGIDCSLTGDLVGRSNTWLSPNAKYALSPAERLVLDILQDSHMDIAIYDEDAKEALFRARAQGHIIISELAYTDPVEDDFGFTIAESKAVLRLTYNQPKQ